MNITTVEWNEPEQTHVIVNAGKEDAILITAKDGDEAYEEIKAWTAKGGKITPFPLDKSKAQAIAQIRASAENAQAGQFSQGVGQSLTYAQKAVEAEAVLSAQNLEASNYPLLAAEASWRGIGLKDMAALVTDKANAHKQRRAEIELMRLDALAKIDAATTHEEITAALNVAWPDQNSET